MVRCRVFTYTASKDEYGIKALEVERLDPFGWHDGDNISAAQRIEVNPNSSIFKKITEKINGNLK